jgi:hypothetical protein
MSDDQYRKNSIPYLAQIFGYNRNEQSDQNIYIADSLGDLSFIANPTTLIPSYGGSFYPLKDNYIRILRPQRSEIVAAYLTLALNMATTEPLSELRVSITKTTSETDLTVVALTPEEIVQKHRTLRGSDTPFSNTPGQMITVFKLDLTSLIPKYGSADFRSDCYVLGLHFPNTPVAAGFKLQKLEINGSALIVRN